MDSFFQTAEDDDPPVLSLPLSKTLRCFRNHITAITMATIRSVTKTIMVVTIPTSETTVRKVGHFYVDLSSVNYLSGALCLTSLFCACPEYWVTYFKERNFCKENLAKISKLILYKKVEHTQSLFSETILKKPFCIKSLYIMSVSLENVIQILETLCVSLFTEKFSKRVISETLF